LDKGVDSSYEVGQSIDRIIRSSCGIEKYRVESKCIIKENGARACDSVLIDEIFEWWVEHEMGFDVVFIRLVNGQILKWVDMDNDLLGALRDVAGVKERPEE
jgi:hypothetical protein